VQAALAAASPVAPPAEEHTETPYAYSQPSGYGYNYQPPPPTSGGSRIVIIGLVAVLLVCCVFACGLVFGFEIIPDILGLGSSSAAPKPATPTPTSLLPIIRLFIG